MDFKMYTRSTPRAAAEGYGVALHGPILNWQNDGGAEQRGHFTVAAGVLQGLNPPWPREDQADLSVDEAVWAGWSGTRSRFNPTAAGISGSRSTGLELSQGLSSNWKDKSLWDQALNQQLPTRYSLRECLK